MLKTIRKFGLEYCDLPTMVWNVSVMLRLLTLDIDSRYKKGIPISFYLFSIFTTICYFYVYLVSVVWFVFWKSRETGNMLLAILVFSLGVSSEIGTTKLIYMYMYRNRVKKIVDGYLKCDSYVEPGSRMSKNLLKILRTVKKRAMIFWIVIIANGVLYILRPLLMPGRHFIEDGQILYGLEPMYDSPNYEIAFFVACMGIYFTVYVPANITALLIVLAGYTEAQMLALGEELNHIWQDAQEHYKSIDFDNDVAIEKITDNEKKIVNEFIKKRLEGIIKFHAFNMDLIQQLEFVFKGAIAAEGMILTVGLIAELLGGLENTYMQIPFALMQVAMDCLTGQRLMDASIKFEETVFNCHWEKFDISNMKTILMMLQCSQKTLTLSAGGISMLSFRLLMSVIRSIYSAYTTLRTTMK